MAGTPFRYRYSRRKWARRGRALADFTLCALIAATEHIAYAFVAVGKWIFYGIARMLRRARVKPSAQNQIGRPPKAILGSRMRQYEPLKGAKPGVRFEDIAGLEEAKREISLRMILPFLHPDLAARYGIRRGGGLLLYGPPGVGKTLVGRAVATELDAAFFHIRPSDILSGQVGEAEANIARLFERLRLEEKAVLFIDEIESLVPSRRKNCSTIMQRVISQMLGEVDGLVPRDPEHTLLLIGATNHLDMVDPAMLRPGRFDTKVFIGPPNAAARKKLLERTLDDKPTDPGLDIQDLVDLTAGMTGAEIVEVVNRAADKAFLLDIAENQRQALASLHFR